MLPVNYGSHSAYQNTFVSEFLKLFPDPFAVPKHTWDIIVKFWYLDLSETDSIMQEFYSLLGKPATRFPSSLLRSYLLSIVLKVGSITEWCSLLKITPLYALHSGFPADNTPGVGTFYDFFNRLWLSDKDNYNNQFKHKKPKPVKGNKCGDKTPCDTDSAAVKPLPLLPHIHLPKNNPFCLIFRLYKVRFLDTSVRMGLVNPEHLSLAGDGTPFETARLERSKRICGCHLYMFVAADFENALSVFPMLERAFRHDMLSFLHTFFSMKSYLPEFYIEKLLLDSAHDAYPLYEYCKTNSITPFIDPNPGHTGHFKYKDDFTIAEDGVPFCKMGLRMHHDGVEKAKHREKLSFQNLT